MLCHRFVIIEGLFSSGVFNFNFQSQPPRGRRPESQNEEEPSHLLSTKEPSCCLFDTVLAKEARPWWGALANTVDRRYEEHAGFLQKIQSLPLQGRKKIGEFLSIPCGHGSLGISSEHGGGGAPSVVGGDSSGGAGRGPALAQAFLHLGVYWRQKTPGLSAGGRSYDRAMRLSGRGDQAKWRGEGIKPNVMTFTNRIAGGEIME